MQPSIQVTPGYYNSRPSVTNIADENIATQNIARKISQPQNIAALSKISQPKYRSLKISQPKYRRLKISQHQNIAATPKYRNKLSQLNIAHHPHQNIAAKYRSATFSHQAKYRRTYNKQGHLCRFDYSDSLNPPRKSALDSCQMR